MQSSTYVWLTELYITGQRIVNHEHTLRKLIAFLKKNHKVVNVAKSLNEFPLLTRQNQGDEKLCYQKDLRRHILREDDDKSFRHY